MAFTVGDFQDLVRLLDQHPEWRSELRRLVLTDELLGLPAAVRGLAEGIARLDERGGRLEAALAALAEAQARTADRLAQLDERVAGLDERVGRLEAALTALAEAQARTAENIAQLSARLDRADRRLDRAESNIGSLRGWQLESRYRERAAAYFRRVVRRPTPLSTQQLVDLMDSPEAVGRLSEAERDDVLLADLVVRGRARDGEGDVYVVVEVSAGIGPYDVERVARRAALLGRLHPTLALVAGEWITEDAERHAKDRGVWRMLDGRDETPEVRAG